MTDDRFEDRGDDDETVVVAGPAVHTIMQTARVQLAFIDGAWQITAPATLEPDPDGPYCTEPHISLTDQQRCLLALEHARGQAFPTRKHVVAAFESVRHGAYLGDPNAPTLPEA